MKFKKIIMNLQVIIMLVALILAIIAIRPNPWNDGLAIRGVVRNSSASIAGIQPPSTALSPMARERVLAINNRPMASVKDYYDFTKALQPNMTITVKTNKNIYRLATLPKYNTIILNETEYQTITEYIYHNETNQTTNVTRQVLVNKTKLEYLGLADLGLSVYEAPTNNLRKGLDLSGGSRIVLKPQGKISQDDLQLTIDNINQRLNVFGLSDVVVRPASDLEGNDFIIIEIAGLTKEELMDLARQGNFEAKIGNDIVFKGGKDITYICRTSECSGIDPTAGCSQSNGGWFCRFRFSISLTPEAAQRQADLTKDLEVVIEQDQNYLSKSLELYLDNEQVDILRIGSELKGNAQTEISISGSGQGTTQQAAMTDALSNMKRLQAILATGSLPVKLEIVKADTISPALGEEFIANAFLIGLIAVIAVTLLVFLVYRRLIVSLPMVFIMITELIIFLGVAAIIGWNLDVSAIAGIIIAIGTGVNDQIVIADETLKGEKARYLNWKDKIKKAFFIIFTAYFTILVAMLPLWFAGAGLLRGFAVTTILGVSVGVFITRPAYAQIVEILYEN